MARHLSAATVIEIGECHEHGESIPSLIARYRVCRSTVYRTLHRYAALRNPPVTGGPVPPWTKIEPDTATLKEVKAARREAGSAAPYKGKVVF